MLSPIYNCCCFSIFLCLCFLGKTSVYPVNRIRALKTADVRAFWEIVRTPILLLLMVVMAPVLRSASKCIGRFILTYMLPYLLTETVPW